MKTPAVSVVLPAYNHAHYVDDCIAAFLVQTCQDFELIVIDDASTDGTAAKVRRHKDPRIKLIERDINRGVAAGMNEGFGLASSDVVCFFATDDLPDPCYLAEVISIFERKPSAVAAYFPLRKMSESGVALAHGLPLPYGAGRFELLRRSFLGGNPLPSPGMAMRRDAAVCSKLPEGVCQYSDWMLNNRLLLSGEVVLWDRPLLSYRVSASSLSARSLGSIARDQLETRIMMDDFLGINEMAILSQIFPVELKPYEKLPELHIPYVLGRLALLSDIAEKRAWGYEVIMRHLSDEDLATSLRLLTGFSFRELMALAPTESASQIEEIRLLRRRIRHLRRWIFALSVGLSLALWILYR